MIKDRPRGDIYDVDEVRTRLADTANTLRDMGESLDTALYTFKRVIADTKEVSQGARKVARSADALTELVWELFSLIDYGPGGIQFRSYGLGWVDLSLLLQRLEDQVGVTAETIAPYLYEEDAQDAF